LFLGLIAPSMTPLLKVKTSKTMQFEARLFA
jgi:hypothetical protein